MKIKKTIHKLHLWLGLTSGLVVFIVGITGSLYAFKDEIQAVTETYRFVENQHRAYLPPSELKRIAEEQLPEHHAHSVDFGDSTDAVRVTFWEPEPRFYWGVYLNPYTGEVIKVHNLESGFFHFILAGHYNLWLPREVGRTIVATSTLIFVVMLISGIVLWWPKKQNRKQRFQVKWSARWRRVNYDMHAAFGFYVSWIAILLALTGLVYGFNWFAYGAYKLAGGEKSPIYREPTTVKIEDYVHASPPMDVVYKKVVALYPEAVEIEMHAPETDSSTVQAAINLSKGTYYKTHYLYFDQYTFEEVIPDHIWGSYDRADFADVMIRMNYDIHVGAIAGIPGKIIACLASLLVASLPVTGTMIWWGRRNKKKGSKGRKA